MGHLAQTSLCPQKYVETLTLPRTCECALSGNRVFANSQVKMRLSEWVPIQQHSCVLIKRGNLDAEPDAGNTPSEDSGGDQSDVSASHGAPKRASNPQRMLHHSPGRTRPGRHPDDL